MQVKIVKKCSKLIFKKNKMKRKVLFKKWIPLQYAENAEGRKIPVSGTGRIEREFNNTGTFHQFGMAMEEDESGNMHEVLPSNMKFIKSEEHIGIEYSKEAVENWVQKLREDRNANLESYQLSGLVRYILNKI